MEMLLNVHVIICFTALGVLSKDFQQDKNVVNELMERIARLEVKQTNQQMTIENQQTEIKYLKSHCGKGDNLLTKETVKEGVIVPTTGRPNHLRRQATGNFVSFSAYLDHDVDLPMFGKLILNKEITNEGGAYDTTTGIFTCPVSGVYLFSFFLGQRDLHQASLHLVVNNERTMDAIVESVKETQDAQGGNVVIKRLVKGDQVWLKLIVGSHIEGASNMRVTSFSGALLHE